MDNVTTNTPSKNVVNMQTEISRLPRRRGEYFDNILQIKLNAIGRLITPESAVLDVCCATGVHLLSFSKTAKNLIGVDFNESYISEANQNSKDIGNVTFFTCDASKMPIEAESIDVAYSLSSLYVIPDVKRIIVEISRVLKKGGKCYIELGNLSSLNTVVCNQHPEITQHFHISIKDMNKFISESGLKIIEHRALQVLPLWGGKGFITRQLARPVAKKIMEHVIFGKMIDEWISNLPFIKRFAFRHIFLCEKI